MEKLDILFQDEHKYTLDEIRVGMRVRVSQLDNIYDTYIILNNLDDKIDNIGCLTMEGSILEISKENNIKKYSNYKDAILIINNSEERNLNIVY